MISACARAAVRARWASSKRVLPRIKGVYARAVCVWGGRASRKLIVMGCVFVWLGKQRGLEFVPCEQLDGRR